MSLSVVISAYNEEEKIKDCLESVTWADEIILIDNQSKDRTAQIASKYTDKIFSHKNNPLRLNESKNFGFTKVSSDWILSLDADERVTPELKDGIDRVINKVSENVNGFLIPRKNIIFGKWIKHGLWYPDYQLRLFRKGKGKFPMKHNHELLEAQGKTEKLFEHLIHYNYQSINQYLYKITYYYSDNEADQLLKKLSKSGKKLEWSDSIRLPASDFLINYFAREGYKDGLHGLVLALLQSFYMFIVFTKAWENQGFWEYDNKDFVNETLKEFGIKGKELKYWLSKIKEDGSPKIKRFLLQAKRKLLA